MAKNQAAVYSSPRARMAQSAATQLMQRAEQKYQRAMATIPQVRGLAGLGDRPQAGAALANGTQLAQDAMQDMANARKAVSVAAYLEAADRYRSQATSLRKQAAAAAARNQYAIAQQLEGQAQTADRAAAEWDAKAQAVADMNVAPNLPRSLQADMGHVLGQYGFRSSRHNGNAAVAAAVDGLGSAEDAYITALAAYGGGAVGKAFAGLEMGDARMTVAGLGDLFDDIKNGFNKAKNAVTGAFNTAKDFITGKKSDSPPPPPASATPAARVLPDQNDNEVLQYYAVLINPNPVNQKYAWGWDVTQIRNTGNVINLAITQRGLQARAAAIKAATDAGNPPVFTTASRLPDDPAAFPLAAARTPAAPMAPVAAPASVPASITNSIQPVTATPSLSPIAPSIHDGVPAANPLPRPTYNPLPTPGGWSTKKKLLVAGGGVVAGGIALLALYKVTHAKKDQQQLPAPA